MDSDRFRRGKQHEQGEKMCFLRTEKWKIKRSEAWRLGWLPARPENGKYVSCADGND